MKINVQNKPKYRLTITMTYKDIVNPLDISCKYLNIIIEKQNAVKLTTLILYYIFVDNATNIYAIDMIHKV